MFSRQISRAIPRATATRAFSTTPQNKFARISIVGNLADAPELIATSTGKELITYSLASNTGPKDARRTSWFKVAAFVPEGPGRDRILSLTKGSLVFLEGDAEMKSYEDKEGNSRRDLNIVQRNVEIIKRKEHDNE